MRLCIIGKYPPIQGGVSRVTFWDAHALAAAGHEVHVVTNAPEVEADYRVREEFYREQPGDDPRIASNVVVHATSGERLRYIPYANPFVSKLAGLATQVAAEASCDLIYAYYLEPYGVAARLASDWTGIPYGLRHAGSDVRRLGRHETLRTTYDRLARDAAFWLDSSSVLRRGWQSRGVAPEQFYSIGRYSLPTGYFHPDAAPMRFVDLGDFDDAAPTIGLYGKLGETKGSFDLLRAFALARGQVGGGNLVVASGGPPGELGRFREMAADLGVDVLTVPFMPHWKIPSFIAACDAVAFLERGFSIDIHRPTVPREVLACGRCLILSAEVAAYQAYADQLRDGENCLIVDPRDTTALAGAVRSVLDSPGGARHIGRNGHRLSRTIEDWPDYEKRLVTTFERIVADLRDRRVLVSAAEMQAAFARLVVDEAFRNWFRLAPDEALAKYELTGDEKVAIGSINKKLLGLFAESLRARRRRDVLGFFPLTVSAVLEERARRYFDRYYDLHPAQPGSTNVDLLLPFGLFLSESLAADSAVPSYAADLCRYEAALAELQVRPLPAEDLLAPPGEETRPGLATAAGVRCLHLSYDIPGLAGEIDRGHVPAAADPQATYVVLRAVPLRTAPDAFKVDAATAALLALCTGENSLEEIKLRLAEQWGDVDSLDAAVTGAIDRLRAAQLISA